MGRGEDAERRWDRDSDTALRLLTPLLRAARSEDMMLELLPLWIAGAEALEGVREAVVRGGEELATLPPQPPPL